MMIIIIIIRAIKFCNINTEIWLSKKNNNNNNENLRKVNYTQKFSFKVTSIIILETALGR